MNFSALPAATDAYMLVLGSICNFVRLAAVQIAGQVAIAQLVICVLVFVTPVRVWSQNLMWIAAFNFAAPAMVFTQNRHIGSQVLAAAKLNGDLLLGPVMGGVAFSLARLPGHAFTAYLCCFAFLAILVAAVIRVRLPPNGMMLALGLVVQLVVGQPLPPSQMWHTSVGILSLVNLVASVSAAFGAIVVLPTWSLDELSGQVASLLEDMGGQMSDFMTVLLSNGLRTSVEADQQEKVGAQAVHEERESPKAAQSKQALAGRPSVDPARGPAESALDNDPPEGLFLPETAQAVCDNLWERTAPERYSAVDPASRGPNSAAMNRGVTKIRQLIGSAQLDIPGHAWLAPRRWLRLCDALQLLGLRASALECILEGEYPLQSAHDLAALIERVHIQGAFQNVYAYLSASCALLGQHIRGQTPLPWPVTESEAEASAAGMEEQLALAVHRALVSYWVDCQARAQHSSTLVAGLEVQARALLFLTTLSNALLEALSSVSEAVSDLQLQGRQHIATPEQKSSPVVGTNNPPASRAGSAQELKPAAGLMQRCKSVSAPGTQASRSVSMKEREAEPLLVQHQGAAPVPRDHRPVRQWLQKLSGQTDEVQVNVDSIGSRKSQPLTSRLVAGALAQRHWLLPCAEGLLGIHVLREGCAVVRDAMRLSASEWWTTIRSRKFVFGLKYSGFLGGCVALIIPLSQNIQPLVDAWHPLFILSTVCLLTNEKVDVTWIKGMHRVIGTCFGSLFAFLCMRWPQSANNPYALTLLLCTWGFLCGALNFTCMGYSAFLACYTGSIVLLVCPLHSRAQYNGESTGFSHQYAVARTTDVAIGSLLVSVLGFIAPWYAADTAMDALGGAAGRAGDVSLQLYDSFYEKQRKLSEAADIKQQQQQHHLDQPAEGYQMEPGLLSKEIASPVFGVQSALETAGKMWALPLLQPPSYLTHILHMMRGLVCRMVALEAALQQAPIISGHFTAASFRYLASPTHAENHASMAALRSMLRCVAQVLSASRGDRSHLLLQLQQSVHRLIDCRVAFKLKYWEVRGRDHELAGKNGSSPWMRERSLDDAVRYLGFIYATTKVLDLGMQLARTVLQDRQLQRGVRVRLLRCQQSQ